MTTRQTDHLLPPHRLTAIVWRHFASKFGGQLLWLALCGVFLLNLAPQSHGSSFSFTPLGDLPGGTFGSWALDVSGDGSVAVGRSRSASGNEGFRWTSGGGMVGLGDLPGGNFDSPAYGVSANGLVLVGRSTSSSGVEAFRWTSGSGLVDLGDLPGGGHSSFARDVSADGWVVVGRSRSTLGYEAFRWTSGGGMVGLGELPGGRLLQLCTWRLVRRCSGRRLRCVVFGFGSLSLDQWRRDGRAG